LSVENSQNIEANASKRPRGRLHWWLLNSLRAIGILILLIFIGSFFLPSKSPHDSAPRVKSASNLRQIGQAIQLYTNENGGRYPDTMGFY